MLQFIFQILFQIYYNLGQHFKSFIILAHYLEYRTKKSIIITYRFGNSLGRAKILSKETYMHFQKKILVKVSNQDSSKSGHNYFNKVKLQVDAENFQFDFSKNQTKLNFQSCQRAQTCKLELRRYQNYAKQIPQSSEYIQFRRMLKMQLEPILKRRKIIPNHQTTMMEKCRSKQNKLSGQLQTNSGKQYKASKKQKKNKKKQLNKQRNIKRKSIPEQDQSYQYIYQLSDKSIQDINYCSFILLNSDQILPQPDQNHKLQQNSFINQNHKILQHQLLKQNNYSDDACQYRKKQLDDVGNKKKKFKSHQNLFRKIEKKTTNQQLKFYQTNNNVKNQNQSFSSKLSDYNQRFKDQELKRKINALEVTYFSKEQTYQADALQEIRKKIKTDLNTKNHFLKNKEFQDNQRQIQMKKLKQKLFQFKPSTKKGQIQPSCQQLIIPMKKLGIDKIQSKFHQPLRIIKQEKKCPNFQQFSPDSQQFSLLPYRKLLSDQDTELEIIKYGQSQYKKPAQKQVIEQKISYLHQLKHSFRKFQQKEV